MNPTQVNTSQNKSIRVNKSQHKSETGQRESIGLIIASNHWLELGSNEYQEQIAETFKRTRSFPAYFSFLGVQIISIEN